jgi:hypothetical protein
MSEKFTLKQHGIEVSNIVRNAMPAVLYQEALAYEKEAAIADSGALMVRSGKKKRDVVQEINALSSMLILKTTFGGGQSTCPLMN